MSDVSGGRTVRERQAAEPRRRIPAARRRLIMVVHIASAVALMGEVWVLVVLNLRATLTDDPVLARSAYTLMETLVFAGGIPLSLTALASGITLAVTSKWGLARHYWVFTKLLLQIAVILVGMLAFDPAGMASAGVASPASHWAQVAVVSSQLVMLLTATTLSVFKPQGRMPRLRG